MGNSKSKKSAKEPDKFFEREKWKEQKREDKRKKNMNPKNKRIRAAEPPLPPVVLATQPPPGVSAPAPAPAQIRSFDEEALNLMRYQMRNDADAFLLNNILLSVQFFENYEREVQQIKNNPISEREHMINEAMVRHNKHVFFADRLQENVNEHVVYQKVRGQSEPLTSPRLFVIYDNVEASEPGDTSDYSAVLDAPFYKLRIEDSKEPGFVKLKKLEVLESTLSKDIVPAEASKIDSGDSIYTDSEKESNDSDDAPYSSKGEAMLEKIKNRLNASNNDLLDLDYLKLNPNTIDHTSRRRSGPIKQVSLQVEKNSIKNMNKLKKSNDLFFENDEDRIANKSDHKIINEEIEIKPRKSILKNTRRLSGPLPDGKPKSMFEVKPISADSIIAEDTETSGYRSNSSSRQNEQSESESDYGYSTITESTTPKRVELSSQSSNTHSSGVLPDETWLTIQTRAVDWSDEEDEIDDSASKLSLSRDLYETHQFLSSTGFMGNFVDSFIIKLGSVLGLSQDSVKNALTQGASVYCDTIKNGNKIGNEVFPALIASWPNTANQWIIRERKIIQNPRTNFSYQWPTKYMVSKATGFGCLLVPIGFRPKRGFNEDQKMQWKIIFPAAERYLENCLAHAHMRCYLFALALHKSFFLEGETTKIGIDASHIKNHLFWQCEDNYARWPEHRLGETLRMFLRSFYVHFGQGRFPNYFIETCNDFKSIPKPVLLKQQRRLADILEAPVMHVLSAIDKLKYKKKEFYPTFNVHRLYDILTSKNPLRILNPNLPLPSANYENSSESEEEEFDTNFWDKAKRQDKHYQWKKEKQRQMHERRKAQFYTRRQRASVKQEKELKSNIILPARLDVERRRLVLEFFIPHFIAMARSSEKFEAIRQAVIYLEQAHRLSMLLKEEPAGDYTANEYLDVIRDKLVDCQTKLVAQGGYKITPRRDSSIERSVHRPIRINRPRYENISAQASPGDSSGFSAFTFVEVHAENSLTQEAVKLCDKDDEESKL